MIKLFKKIGIVLALLAACDMLAGVALDWVRDHSPDGRYYKTRYSLETCRNKVVVLGSSRGEINYVSQIIEDSLGMSCWNASRGGQGAPYFRAIQEGILKRHTPRVVILNIDEYDLEAPPNYEIAAVLRPFYYNHPEIRPILDKTSPFECLLMRSRLYAYNSSYYYLIRPYFIKGLDGKISDKGWKPRLEKMSVEISKTDSIPEIKNAPLNAEAVALFDTLVRRFEEKGSEVILVVSPNYGRIVSGSSTLEYLKKYSTEHHLPLLVYSDDPEFVYNSEYYVDPSHLNVDGARIFTRHLSHQIKPLIQQYHITHHHDNTFH